MPATLLTKTSIAIIVLISLIMINGKHILLLKNCLPCFLLSTLPITS